MGNCSKCQELITVVSIKTLGDLQQMIRLVQARLATGDLVEDAMPSQDGGNFSLTPFSTLAANGPWPDMLQYCFHCTACGQSFRLEVETYHGAGGTWSSLN